ncbi:hypothetical protein FB451DRAFT_1199099 [Mycena latifolia]|nr:hypothetical protein FB451DRAFT_1199099 [Mycena latifolia]
MPPKISKSNADAQGEVGARRKPGNKGDFRGAWLEFLNSKVDEYVTASKEKTTRDFFRGLMTDYWSRFHWTLPLDVEPEGRAPDDGEMSEAELKEKEKAMDSMKIKVKTWYNHKHKHTALGLDSNPFTPWLSRMRRPVDKAPKCIADYQFYMRHEEFTGGNGQYNGPMNVCIYFSKCPNRTRLLQKGCLKIAAAKAAIKRSKNTACCQSGLPPDCCCQSGS